MPATALTSTAMPALRVVPSTPEPAEQPWWERRAQLRAVVGGCPDHWWKPAAPRSAACTCDRFTS